MNLTFDTFRPLLPLAIVSLTTVLVMLAVAFRRNHWWNATLAVVGLNLSLITTIYLSIQSSTGAVTGLFLFDSDFSGGFSLLHLDSRFYGKLPKQ